MNELSQVEPIMQPSDNGATPDRQRWLGRRYYPISQYFKHKLGIKLTKIPVSVAERCPIQDSNGRLQPCIFCDQYGSAAYHEEIDQDLLEQISRNRQQVDSRLKGQGYLIYFQSYTNTLDKVAVLQQRFETALSVSDVHGLVIGTRADCLPARILPVLNELAQRTYLLVEIGVQSFFDDQLDYIKRGHAASKNIEALHKLHQYPDIDLGIHLIFGIPGDTPERIVETALLVNSLPISNVKLHNLYVLKGTPLEQLYLRGEFEPDDLATYADKVILFLRHLSPDIAVQRLASVASRWQDLVAPHWTRAKFEPIEFIENTMRERGLFQGDLYDPKHLSAYANPIITCV